jgi:hypothetical protein
MTRTEHLVSALSQLADQKRRLQVDTEVWPVFEQVFPDDARAADARERLRRLLSQAEAEERLAVSKKTDRLGPVPLPTFVTLPQTRESRKRRPAGPWLASLSWTQGLDFDERQYEILDQANSWLRDRPDDAPVVPAEERSLQVFGDEKAISRQAGGATLWQPGRLDSSLLRFENVAMPFPYRQVGDGHRVLMVENTAAFRTCSRLLGGQEGHAYYAVAFGQGKWAPKTVPFAKELPAEISAIDYWGDLDAEGLKIAGDVREAALEVGLAASCHWRLWSLLLDCEPVDAGSTPANLDSRISVLPADLREGARRVLGSGLRIPQERLGYEVLRQVGGWWESAVS